MAVRSGKGRTVGLGSRLFGGLVGRWVLCLAVGAGAGDDAEGNGFEHQAHAGVYTRLGIEFLAVGFGGLGADGQMVGHGFQRKFFWRAEQLPHAQFTVGNAEPLQRWLALFGTRWHALRIHTRPSWYVEVRIPNGSHEVIVLE